MRNALFTFAASVSAVLFLLVAASWIYGQFVHHAVSFSHVRSYELLNLDRSCMLIIDGKRQRDPQSQMFNIRAPISDDARFHHRRVPFNWGSDCVWPFVKLNDYMGGEGYGEDAPHFVYFRHWIVMPYWLLMILSAVCPVLWLLKRRRTPHSGHCAKCNYDLRATPNRCPECGAIPERSASVFVDA